MRVDVITIFPALFPGPLGEGVIGRASDKGLLELRVHDLRVYAAGPHRQVDDEPFGGGGGMVLKPEPLFAAVEDVHGQVATAGTEPGPVILLSPQGERLQQRRVEWLARLPQMTLICGRYEGVDERVRQKTVDFEVSIGDYVTSGGELPAMVIIEAVTRLQPGALGDADAARHDSFSDALLDYPQYTRPAKFRGIGVPEVLRSGNHQAIGDWRRRQALLATSRKRPDLLSGRELSEQEVALLSAPQRQEGSTAPVAADELDAAVSVEEENPRRALLAAGNERQE
ncbi:MAG: tRNA (guanosine(37)-N1)-methyltransferase TrmD [Acidobacteriota bacterium]